ncbi:MAG: GNAT family N-acetyltransferase [Gemmatimonadetes bacterium]|nr:GNAT family N-acetyltransferase [Gemmatimonadota bacterium]
MSTAPARKSSHRLVTREINRQDDPDFDAAYALLAQTFSRAELVTKRDWKATLAEKASAVWTDLSWHLLVVRRGTRVVGLVTGTYFGHLNAGMVGYLATDPAERGAGIGSRLRQRLRMAFEKDAHQLRGESLGAILGEVSAENPWLRTLARREGVIVLDTPYFQPSLRADDDPSPFFLYWQQLRPPFRNALSVAEVRRIFYAIWRRGYRVDRPLERATFRRMLRALSKRRKISSARLSPRGLE